MPQENPPRRRRPRQVIPQAPDEEPPRRIVIDGDDDAPDWLVSAGQVSGAASRRGKSARAEEEATRTRESAGRTPRAAQAPKTGKTPATGRAGDAKSTSARGTTAQTAKKAAQPRKTTRSASTTPKPSAKARARRAQRIRRGLIGLLAAAVVITLAVVGAVGGSRLLDIKQTLDRGDGVFYPNIFVNDIPLEGKTLDEAAAVVTQQVMSLISNWKITLRTQDGRSWDITGSDLNMQYDVADQLDQLWTIGHTGTSQSRYEQVKALQEAPILRYTTLTYDMSAINQILTQIKSEVDRAPVSATRVDDDTKWPPFSYTDEVPGQELDITGLNERIMGMVDRLESGVVDLTPTRVEAPITRAYLEGQIVKLSTYETSIGKTGDYVQQRHENIRIGTERFNHLIIKAGESVSFNKVALKRSTANGYQEALEIVYGKYEVGIGGGICQVSSTLYNAVVNAGLKVTTRTPHAIPSSYVPMGQDATVSDDRYDFVFKNNTGADIYIEATYYQKKNNYYYTQFTIYGRPDPDGYTYKFESQVRETIPLPEPTYVPDKNLQYVVYTDDEPYVYSKGREGYIVDVYLVTTDANGLEVSRVLDHTDTYKASSPVYYVGTMQRETPSPEVTSSGND